MIIYTKQTKDRGEHMPRVCGTAKISAFKMTACLARRQMSVRELAEKAGVTAANIYRAMSGGRCRPAVLGKISIVLGVDPEELMQNEGR